MTCRTFETTAVVTKHDAHSMNPRTAQHSTPITRLERQYLPPWFSRWRSGKSRAWIIGPALGHNSTN